ncbi:hypothetical protein Syun_023193 [Stephania yunnanensis]|uniref:Uncharacterized protein n=1 Tax=Stephania yunnanensis TaxID=152371 RepID=A0AAP0FBF8_9MAGN
MPCRAGHGPAKPKEGLGNASGQFMGFLGAQYPMNGEAELRLGQCHCIQGKNFDLNMRI